MAYRWIHRSNPTWPIYNGAAVAVQVPQQCLSAIDVKLGRPQGPPHGNSGMQAGKNRTEGFREAGCFRGVTKIRKSCLCFLFKREICGEPDTTMSSQPATCPSAFVFTVSCHFTGDIHQVRRESDLTHDM